jgi:hypothetical protein
MTLSMYQASVPVFLRGLENLSVILAKGAAHAEARKIEPAVFINARLAPDMFPFSRQIQIVSDTAKGCTARLAGAEVPSYQDTESTFAELEARIAKTVAFVKGISAAQIDGSEERKITLKTRAGDLTLRGQDFLFKQALPNFFLHVTTAYDILRHNGVDVGKGDYIGKLA